MTCCWQFNISNKLTKPDEQPEAAKPEVEGVKQRKKGNADEQSEGAAAESVCGMLSLG